MAAIQVSTAHAHCHILSGTGSIHLHDNSTGMGKQYYNAGVINNKRYEMKLRICIIRIYRCDCEKAS